MTATIKLLANTATVNTTPQTIFSAKAVYLTNNSAASVLVTQIDPVANAQVGSLRLAPNNSITVIKKPTDTLEIDAGSIAGSSVAFTN